MSEVTQDTSWISAWSSCRSMQVYIINGILGNWLFIDQMWPVWRWLCHGKSRCNLTCIKYPKILLRSKIVALKTISFLNVDVLLLFLSFYLYLQCASKFFISYLMKKIYNIKQHKHFVYTLLFSFYISSNSFFF